MNIKQTKEPQQIQQQIQQQQANNDQPIYHCVDEQNLAADPLISPRFPLRTLNQALDSRDDRHSDPGCHCARPALIACAACTTNEPQPTAAAEFCAGPARISISEAVHRVSKPLIT
jgi:hypothetical protein